jgi:hypothetical protein
MFQALDPIALRLHAEARREVLRASMIASRGEGLRQKLGIRLIRLGERMADPEPMALRPAADCG